MAPTGSTVTQHRQHPTLSALRGALMVMEAAELVGLPIPTYVTTSSYAVASLGGSDTSVSWQPDNLVDLHRWADWLGAEVTQLPHADEDDGKVFHAVFGHVFDQRVDLCYIEGDAEHGSWLGAR